MCACLTAQSCPALCDCMDSSLPGSSVHRIFQAGILEPVPISSSRGSSNPGVEPKSPESPVLAGRFFTTVQPGKPVKQIYPNFKKESKKKKKRGIISLSSFITVFCNTTGCHQQIFRKSAAGPGGQARTPFLP